MKIIGLTGKKGSGKTTVANFIANQIKLHAINYKNIHIIPLAEPIKQILSVIEFGDCTMAEVGFYDEEEIKKEHVLNTTCSRRKFLQDVGTLIRNDFGEDYFVKLVLHKANDRHVDTLIVPDIRYDNEANFLIDAGAKIYLIDRPLPDDGDTHSSEAGISQTLIYNVIYNEGTIHQLCKNALEKISL